MNKAIQFIGTQRSGSNLLRLILNQHDLISAPHPPHLLKTFIPLLPHYKVANGNKLDDLVEDMCQWVESNPVPWTDVVLNRDKVLTKVSSIYNIFEQIYLSKAIADQAEIWCCKSVFNIHYTYELEKSIKPFYIYLYRDGRDVAASFKKAIVGPKHAYHLAVKWRDEQIMSLTFLKKIEMERKIHISYEALLNHPEKVVTNICNKLEIEYSAKMLLYYTSMESRHTAESGKMWESVTKPIIRDNNGKFHNELTSEEIQIFEQVAGDALKLLGYELLNPNENKAKLDIENYNVLNAQLITEIKEKAPNLDIQKRMAQENLLRDIQNRLKVLV